MAIKTTVYKEYVVAPLDFVRMIFDFILIVILVGAYLIFKGTVMDKTPANFGKAKLSKLTTALSN